MGGAPHDRARHLRAVRSYRRLGGAPRLERELWLRRRHARPGRGRPDLGRRNRAGVRELRSTGHCRTRRWRVSPIGRVGNRQRHPRCRLGDPDRDGAGSPVFAVRTNQVDVRNTWDVSGVRATGSNNVTADGIFVPTELTVALDTAPRIDGPLYRGFIPTLVFPGCTAVAAGVSGRAIDEAVALVGTKRAMTGGTVADAARTQHTIAKSEAAVTAARLLLKHTAEELQRAGDDITLQQRAALRAAMTHADDVSRETLVALYEIAGSAALYRSNPIDRIFRDGMAALHHANHSAPFLEG